MRRPFISVWQQPMLVWCSPTNNICSVHRSCSNRLAPRVFVAASTVSLSTPRVTLYTKFNGSFVSHPCILPPRPHLLPAHLRWVGAKVDPAPCRSPAGIFIYICLMCSVKCSASAVRWISHIHRCAPIIVSRHRRHSKTPRTRARANASAHRARVDFPRFAPCRYIFVSKTTPVELVSGPCVDARSDPSRVAKHRLKAPRSANRRLIIGCAVSLHPRRAYYF